MVTAGDVLLDIACSPRVRAALQAVFPSVRLRVHDIEAMIAKDRVALNTACAIVFGVRNHLGDPSLRAFEGLRAIAPHIGIFVVDERSEILDLWLRRLAVSGVDDALALDRPGDEKVLRSVLANRVAVPPPELALRQLSSLWADCPVSVESMYCVRNGYRPRHRFKPHVWFGLKDRAMRLKFEHAGIPTPLFLTRFGRELHRKESLLRDRRSRLEIATLLGFETLSQLGIEHRRVRRMAARWPALAALLG